MCLLSLETSLRYGVELRNEDLLVVVHLMGHCRARRNLIFHLRWIHVVIIDEVIVVELKSGVYRQLFTNWVTSRTRGLLICK